MKKLIELAQYAMSKAKSAGADFVDVSLARGRSVEVEVQESDIVSCELHSGVSACVRAFVRGGCGIHMCHGIEKGDLDHAAAAAVSSARTAGADPDFKSLPHPQPAGMVPSLDDDWVLNMTPSGVAEIMRENIARANSVDDTANLSGGCAFVSTEGAFVNSLGIEADEVATSASAEFMAVMRKGEQLGSYAEFDTGRTQDSVNLVDVGVEAVKGALRYMAPGEAKGGKMPVVFAPIAAAGVISSIASAACADPLQRNRSFLAGKLGSRIAPSILTIEDDGRFPGGMQSSSRDGEGTPRRPIKIIEKGVFVNALHNSYTAGKDKSARSTGHGNQFGNISPTNLRPSVGLRPSKDIIGDIEDGLFVEGLMFAPNPVTGEFSATVDWAMKIENGELAYPITGLAISGNMLEFLGELDAISSDYREEPGSVLPYMRFRSIQVAAGA